jgi:hypothetical protein
MNCKLLLRFLSLLALVAADALPGSPARAEAQELKNFLIRRGDKLFDGENEFRFISFNIPNLMVIEDAYEFTRPNPWRWPDDYDLCPQRPSRRVRHGRVRARSPAGRIQ